MLNEVIIGDSICLKKTINDTDKRIEILGYRKTNTTKSAQNDGYRRA